MTANFELCAELYGHRREARTINYIGMNEAGHIFFVSGSTEGSLVIWKSENGGKTYDKHKEDYSHNDFIVASCNLPENKGFVTGCKDKNIRIFNLEGDLLQTIAGHNGIVGSVAVHPTTGQLLSGSWDGTAKIWDLSPDLKAANCVATLEGQENSVCVLGLPNGNIVTGSAGIRGQTRIEHSKVRIWNKQNRVIATMTQHDAPVKCLRVHPNKEAFFSCSNDGSIIKYKLDGTVLTRYQNPIGYEGHPGFISNIDVNEVGQVMSAADDFNCRLFTGDGDNFEPLPHPNSVWDVSFLPNGDVVTACCDSVVRVFSRCDERKAPIEVIKGYIERCEAALQDTIQRQTKQQQLDPSRYPEFNSSIQGSKHGEAKLFRREGKLWYYTWNAPNFAWDLIGECQGVMKENKIDGVEYDDVIDVEVESASSGGLRVLKIGINANDNPYNVASDFCKKNDIPLDQIEAIVNHIAMQTQRKGPTTFEYGNDKKPDTIMGFTPRKFPLPSSTGLILDRKGDKLEKALKVILEKVKEYNNDVPEEGKLTESDFLELDLLLNTLNEMSRYHSSNISVGAVLLFEKILKTWDVKHIFPVLDLLGLTLVHPDAINSFKTKLKFMLTRVMNLVAVDNFTGDTKKLRFPVSLTAIKVFANIFKTSQGASLAVEIVQNEEQFDQILTPLKAIAQVDKKDVRRGVAISCLNLANALSHGKVINEDCNFLLCSILSQQFITRCVELGEIHTVQKSVMALGSLFYEKFRQKKALSEEEKVLMNSIVPLIQQVNSNDLDKELVDEYVTLVGQL